MADCSRCSLAAEKLSSYPAMTKKALSYLFHNALCTTSQAWRGPVKKRYEVTQIAQVGINIHVNRIIHGSLPQNIVLHQQLA